MTIQKSKSLIQIADELEEEPTDIQSLYECVTQNINLTVEEIYKIYISTNKTNKELHSLRCGVLTLSIFTSSIFNFVKKWQILFVSFSFRSE